MTYLIRPTQKLMPTVPRHGVAFLRRLLNHTHNADDQFDRVKMHQGGSALAPVRPSQRQHKLRRAKGAER